MTIATDCHSCHAESRARRFRQETSASRATPQAPGASAPRRIVTGLGLALCFAILPVLAPPAAEAGTRSLKEIREAGVIVQKWDTSCAAAAMATVFTFHFGDPVTEREVARGLLAQTEPLKVRHRGGFSMLDMKRYAEARGYRALGFRAMTLDDIRYFDGAIVPVVFKGYPHYVVLKGVTSEGEIHIADPAYGNRWLSREAFEEAWTDGIAFVMRRTSE